MPKHREGMYQGWVGVSTLPELVESESWKNFATATMPRTKYWLDQGLSGWRMDVAPWVSDEFWREWRTAVKSKDPDALTVAETWFDASKFFLGDEFDSTMNYIFRNAVLDYAAGGNAAELYHNLELMRENYPPQAFYALMNLLSTHDAARLCTSSVTPPKPRMRRVCPAKHGQAGGSVPDELSRRSGDLHGDEVGVTGGEDPFNRGTYRGPTSVASRIPICWRPIRA
jgi:glycosidase